MAGHVLRHQAGRGGDRAAGGVAHRQPDAEEPAPGPAGCGPSPLLSFVAIAFLHDPVSLGGAGRRRWPAPGRQVRARAVRRRRRPRGAARSRWRRTPTAASSSTTARRRPSTRASASRGWPRVAVVGALLWLLPMAALVAWQGWDGALTQMALVLHQGRAADLRRRLCGAALCVPGRGGAVPVAHRAADDRRPGAGRDHARAADHGRGLCRLRRRLGAAGAGAGHAVPRRGAGGRCW